LIPELAQWLQLWLRDAIDTLQDTACIVGIIDANTQRLKKTLPI
jgi:hypothetical protein